MPPQSLETSIGNWVPGARKLPEPKIEQLKVKDISVAPQMREHFNEEDISGLADSIRSFGLINPLIVAKMNESLARQYLSLANEIWGKVAYF